MVKNGTKLTKLGQNTIRSKYGVLKLDIYEKYDNFWKKCNRNGLEKNSKSRAFATQAKNNLIDNQSQSY